MTLCLIGKDPGVEVIEERTAAGVAGFQHRTCEASRRLVFGKLIAAANECSALAEIKLLDRIHHR